MSEGQVIEPKKRKARTPRPLSIQPQMEVEVQFSEGGKSLTFRAYSYHQEGEFQVFVCPSDVPGFQRTRRVRLADARYIDITEPPRQNVGVATQQGQNGWTYFGPAPISAYSSGNVGASAFPPNATLYGNGQPVGVEANPLLGPRSVPRPPYANEGGAPQQRLVTSDNLLAAIANGGSSAGLMDG